MVYVFLSKTYSCLPNKGLIKEKVPELLALYQQLDEMLRMLRVDMILESLRSFYY